MFTISISSSNFLHCGTMNFGLTFAVCVFRLFRFCSRCYIMLPNCCEFKFVSQNYLFCLGIDFAATNFSYFHQFHTNQYLYLWFYIDTTNYLTKKTDWKMSNEKLHVPFFNCYLIVSTLQLFFVSSQAPFQ